MTLESYINIGSFLAAFLLLGLLYQVLYKLPAKLFNRHIRKARPSDKNTLILDACALVNELIREYKKQLKGKVYLQQFEVQLRRNLPACVLTSAIVMLNGYGWQFEKNSDGKMTVFPNTQARINSHIVHVNGPENYDPSVTQASVVVRRSPD